MPRDGVVKIRRKAGCAQTLFGRGEEFSYPLQRALLIAQPLKRFWWRHRIAMEIRVDL